MSNTATIRARQRAMDIYKIDPNDSNYVVSRSGNRMTRDEAAFLGVCVIEDSRTQQRSEADTVAKSQERTAFKQEVLGSKEAKARPALAREFLADPDISKASAQTVIKQLALHRTDKDKEWAKQVLKAPEAKDRPKAAQNIIDRYGADTMPLDRARAFLRGLPLETQIVDEDATSRVEPASNGQSLQRRLELRAAALSLKADRGDEAARKEANTIAYAFRVNRETRMSLADACKSLGVNI